MPLARTLVFIFLILGIALASFSVSSAEEEGGGIFIDPNDANLIRRTQVPFESQVLLATSELPQRSSLHPAVLFTAQKFSYVSVSPDGGRLAFSVKGENHDWSGIFDLADRSIRELTLRFESRALRPNWSPDGRFLIIEEEGNFGKQQMEVFDLTEGSSCVLDGRRARNKFLNLSEPWFSENGDKVYFKVEVNNPYRRSLGLKPSRIPPRIGEATRQCAQLALYPVAEFLAEFPTALLPGRVSTTSIKPSTIP